MLGERSSNKNLTEHGLFSLLERRSKGHLIAALKDFRRNKSIKSTFSLVDRARAGSEN